MPQQGLPQQPDPPEQQIAALVRDFQNTPHDFFCEHELHAHFYRLGRDRMPNEVPDHGRQQRHRLPVPVAITMQNTKETSYA